METLILLASMIGAEPTPKFVVENRTTPVFTVENRVTRGTPSVFLQRGGAELVTTGGKIIVLGSDGMYRYKNDVPPVSLRQPPSTAGGCGCTASRNCGASFCKSRGGTGCPQSCPVK